MRLALAPRRVVEVLAALLALASATARGAEFEQGVRAYEAKDFAAARAIFEDLAALGDAASQYDLGAMWLRGEGVAKDRGVAAGWMLAARENGHDPTPGALDALVAGLSAAEREAADRILARVGRAALASTVLPPVPKRGSEQLEPPRLLGSVDATYPGRAGEAGIQGMVLLRVELGADGRPRDPDVVFAAQSAEFDRPDGSYASRRRAGEARSLAEAAQRDILRRRYAPARLDGQPVPVTYTYKLVYKMAESASLVAEPVRQRLVQAARDGDPRSQYLVGALGLAGAEPAPPRGGWVLAAAQAGVPEAQLRVGAELLHAGHAARSEPWLERAAAAGLPAARVRLALALAEREPAPAARVRELLAPPFDREDRWAARHAAQLLACSSRAGLRDPAAAVALARSVGLDADRDPSSLEAWAAALASAGEAEHAAKAQRKAIEAARELGWDAEALERRRAEYERGRPCDRLFLPAPRATQDASAP